MIEMIVRLILFYVALCQASGSILPDQKAKIEAELKGFGVYPYLPNVLTWAENAKCRNDSLLLLENLRNQTSWAMQMWDASTKEPVGVYRGKSFELGHFDECVDVATPIEGHYCLATVTLSRPEDGPVDPNVDIKDPFTSIWNIMRFSRDDRRLPRNVLNWALCVPASCSHTDVQASLTEYLATPPVKDNRTHASVAVNSIFCQTKRKGWDPTWDAIAYCTAIGIILLATVLSTIYDFRFVNEENGTKNGVLGYFLCFSLKRNIPDMSVSVTSESSIDCIYGIKFLSMCLVLICHRKGIGQAGPNNDFTVIENNFDALIGPLFYHGDVYVDTFFVLSGLLVTYGLLEKLEKRSVNPFQALFFRYIRLTPAYAVVIFFYTSLIYELGDGPSWELLVGADRDACRENWWTNLLYINNYFHVDNLCMFQSWYLPCDTHLFIFAVFVICFCHKRPKTGFTIVALTTVISVAIPTIETYYGHFPPVLLFTLKFVTSPRTHGFFLKMYTATHIRASPYLVGMATGYLLFKTRKSSTKYTWLPTLGTILSFVIFVGTMVPTIYFYNPSWQYDATLAAAYGGTFRLFWGIGIALLIVSVTLSKKCLVKAVLSWNPLKVLSNLVYSMYLVQVAVQTVQSGNMRVPFHGNHFNDVREIIADLTMTTFVAFVLYITVEAPTHQIFRQIFRKKSK